MSSQRALQLHSLILNDKIDTWDDWKIVSIKRPVFNEPELKSEYVEVPGRDGNLDMTEVLTGYPLYDNRRGTLQFFLYDDSVPALSKLNTLRNYLHGRKHKIVLNDEPEYYYIGRLMMHESHPTTEGEYAAFDLEYDLEPYKYEAASSVGDWLWDPFNFETGVIREYANMQISNATAGQDITLIGSRKPTVPKFTVSYYPIEPQPAPTPTPYIEITFNDVTYECPVKQTTIIPQIVLMDEEYTIHARSMYNQMLTLAVDMRGGSL